MNVDEYEPSVKDPLIKEFYDVFNGGFIINVPDGEVFYYNNHQIYGVPDNKEAFFEIINKSINNKMNYFLDNPVNQKKWNGKIVY
jgi:hypothetical protein